MPVLLRAVVGPFLFLIALSAGTPTSVFAQVPVTPTLSAEFGGNWVSLQWTLPDPNQADSFQIEAGSAPGLADFVVFSTPGNARQYAAVDVPYGIYYVRIRAVAGAAVSAPSNEIVVTLGPCDPPAPRLEGYVSTGEVVLSWATDRAFGCHARYFLIEAGRGPGTADVGVFPHISSILRASFPNVPFGTYYVRLRGVGHAGAVGPASNELVLSVGCSPPPAILSVRADVIGNAARFSWQYSGTSAADYTVAIEAGSSPGSANLGSLVVPRTANSGFNAAAVAGTYYTRVRATNACGSTVSPELPVTLTAECPVPDPIPFIDASRHAGAGSLTVQWAPPDTGGLVMAYDVKVGSAPGLDDLARRTVDGRYTPSSLGGVGFNTSFTNIVPDRVYARVLPVNTCGSASRAAEARGVAGACLNPPAPPSASAIVTGNSVTLSWTGTAEFEVPYRTFVEIGTTPFAADVLVSPQMTSFGTPSFTTTLPAGRYHARARRLYQQCDEVSNPSREVTFVIP